jgi:hypothetical protein|tara:strand:+ start:379 stop:564 length:186 start_codon:yes stop_codon:yes gene_type:complete
MKEKIYYFTFFDQRSRRAETLEVMAKTFAEACPGAYIHKINLNKKYNKSNWDIISVKSKIS